MGQVLPHIGGIRLVGGQLALDLVQLSRHLTLLLPEDLQANGVFLVIVQQATGRLSSKLVPLVVKKRTIRTFSRSAWAISWHRYA